MNRFLVAFVALVCIVGFPDGETVRMSHESASSSAKTTKTSRGTVATTPVPTTRTWAPTTPASTSDASTTHAPTTHASTTTPTTTHSPTTHASTTNTSATRAPLTQVPTSPTFTPHSYILTSSNGLECLKLYTALQFSIKYEGRGKKVLTHTQPFSNGYHSQINGTCPERQENGNEFSSLIIRFDETYNATFEFVSKGNKTWHTSRISLDFNLEKLPNASEIGEVCATNFTSNESQIVPMGNMLVCNATVTQTLNSISPSGINITVVMQTQNFALEAFGYNGERNGTKITHCSADLSKELNIVTIAVGVAFSVFVIICLLAFIIKGKKNEHKYRAINSE